MKNKINIFSMKKIDIDTLKEIMNHFNQMLYLASILNNDENA